MYQGLEENTYLPPFPTDSDQITTYHMGSYKIKSILFSLATDCKMITIFLNYL